MKKNREVGFTLLELLVTSVMVCVISLAIYTTFTNGIKIWQRINTHIPEEDLGIFFERFSSDLRNNLRFRDSAFSGSDGRLEFSSLVDSPRLNKRTIGEIVYSYDAVGGTLIREEKDFSHIYTGERGRISQLLKNIGSLNFQYYFYNEEEKEYYWVKEYEHSGLSTHEYSTMLAETSKLLMYKGWSFEQFKKFIREDGKLKAENKDGLLKLNIVR